MNINKSTRRDRKRNKKNKMIVDSKSVFTIRDQQKKRSEEIRKKRKEKYKDD